MFTFTVRAFSACCLFLLSVPIAHAAPTPINNTHVAEIKRQFLEQGLFDAEAAIDSDGRVSLRGAYANSRAVDLAFSIAQTVVGVRWVSPVTPDNIKQRDWAKAMSSFFPTSKGASAPPPKPEEIKRIDSSRPGRIGQKYGLIVGIGTFETSITPLKYAAKDANDFYEFLTSASGGDFPKSNVTLLIDQKATRAGVEQALRAIQARAQENDLVVVYFSSHGTPPNKNGAVQVVTYDTQVKPRPMVWETSLSEDVLAGFIQGVKSKRLVVVMDTCYSNGAYRKVDNFLPAGGKSLGGDDEEGYGNSRNLMAKRLLGAKDLVLEDEKPSLPVASSSSGGDGWGRVLISASDAGERSWESETLRNSFFTYYFLNGMSKVRDVKSAFEYAKPNVSHGVRTEKDQVQTPQVAYDQKDWAIRLR